MTTDMTVGRPESILWRFALPLLLSAAFQQIYQIADSVIAGRLVGGPALAAIGASHPITMVFMAFALGMSLGCSVVVSQLFGAQENTRLKTAATTSIISSVVLSGLLTIFGLFFYRHMLLALDTDPYIFADAGVYLKINIYGLFFLFLFNICTGIFTALGDSRTPLYLLILSSVANIVLDILFVTWGGMGVSGVAWATFIAQGVCSVLAFLLLHRRLQRAFPGKAPLFSFSIFQHMAGIAIPSILQQSFISVGNLIVQRLINGYGWAVVGGFSAAIRLNTFAIVALSALGNAVSSFTAQNIGAGLEDRALSGLKASFKLAFFTILPFTLIYTLFSRQSVGMFLDASESASIAAGAQFLRIVAPFYALIAVKLCADGVLRGAGAMRAFMAATFSDLILRIVLSHVFSHWLHETGIWLSWPVGWTFGALVSVFFAFSGVWRKKPPAAPQETVSSRGDLP